MLSPNEKTNRLGFTLVESLIAMGVGAIFASALFATWNGIGTTVVNSTSYAQRQSEQMRVFDYLKRDIRRATNITILSGGMAVTGNNFGNVLQLTIPDYYVDSREEDNAIGSRVAGTPTLAGSTVSYGGTLTVLYYALNGAVIRSEGGVVRTVADAAGGFTLSFSNDVSGLVRCRLLYNQLLRSATGRRLQRQIDILCGQRSQLQPGG